MSDPTADPDVGMPAGRPAGGLSVCVFLASSEGLPEAHRSAARRLGGLLAARGHQLVYGGGSAGLMGELARAMQAGGGRVFGAIARFLVEREVAYEAADELLKTDTLRERKAAMDERADAFIVLPGGFGTLEELLEVLTLRMLGLHDRPIVLVSVDGYWEPFLALAREMVGQGFARGGEGVLFDVADSPEAALELVEEVCARQRAGDPPESGARSTGARSPSGSARGGWTAAACAAPPRRGSPPS